MANLVGFNLKLFKLNGLYGSDPQVLWCQMASFPPIGLSIYPKRTSFKNETQTLAEDSHEIWAKGLQPKLIVMQLWHYANNYRVALAMHQSCLNARETLRYAIEWINVVWFKSYRTPDPLQTHTKAGHRIFQKEEKKLTVSQLSLSWKYYSLSMPRWILHASVNQHQGKKS